jgi:sigma-B regulation protein RsbU (phosphoserine phosphatase)
VSETAAVSRVLVVDDSPVIRLLLCRVLEARGYRVESAESGEAALQRLAGRPPDLLFLDVALPGISGLDVLRAVRARGLDTAVILITASGSEAVAVEALRGGADDYLRKPFSNEEFAAVLERTVRRLELSRRNAALQRELDEKRRQLEQELARAAEVQAGLLPRAAPTLPGWELAVRFYPAREVSGDFYDWQEVGHGSLALTVGDVMGKGMAAALLMATVRAALRAVAPHHPPAEAVQLVAAALEPDLARADSFVTLFQARLEGPTQRLVYVDAGHGLAFVRRASGAVEALGPRTLPLGVLAEETYREGVVTVAPGDALLVYSDGLLDARPDLAQGEAPLARVLAGAQGAEALAARLERAAELKGPPVDDLTILVLYHRA